MSSFLEQRHASELSVECSVCLYIFSCFVCPCLLVFVDSYLVCYHDHEWYEAGRMSSFARVWLSFVPKPRVAFFAALQLSCAQV